MIAARSASTWLVVRRRFGDVREGEDGCAGDAAGGFGLAAAEALAGKIIEKPPLAVRANVRVMRWFVNETQRQSRLYTQGRGLHLTEDFPESASAFVDKRKPVFKGR